MEHLRFKSEMTAAAYVAGKLDPELETAFELHMMSCPDCVGEVETWRALKGNLQPQTPARLPEAMPLPAVRVAEAASASASEPIAPALPRRAHTARPRPPAVAERTVPAPSLPVPASAPQWRMALTLAAVAVAGAAGGWFARSLQSDADSIGFYSLPAVVRGPADCATAHLGPGVNLLAVRVPGAARDQQLVLVDNDGHDLAPERYSVRTQGDGTWLAQLSASALRQREIRFEARSLDGTVEPRGCLIDSGTQ